MDALAKQATVDGVELDVEIPPEELTQIIKRELFRKWTEEYNNNPKGKYLEQILTLKSKCWYYNMTKLNSFETKLMNRVITGHTYNKCFLYLIKKVSDN